MDLQSIYDENYYNNYNTGLGPIAYDRSNPHWLWFFGNIADKILKDLKPKSILDVGCAKGFLVESFRDRGGEAFGIDISEYAINEVRQDIKKYCKVSPANEKFDSWYDLITCIEVLEHLTEQDSQKAIENICKSTDDVIFSSTPDDFSEKTHINVQPLSYWIDSFARHGFYLDTYNCSFIIDHAMRFRKMNHSIAIYNFRTTVKEKDTLINILKSELIKSKTEIKELQDALDKILMAYSKSQQDILNLRLFLENNEK